MNKIVFSFLFFFGSLQAEYIIFKNKPDESLPITDPAEYSKIYNILTTYQWPSIIGTSAQLPAKEILDITAVGNPAEEMFLRRKLQEISPEYDLVFLPTTLYELFIIYKHSNNEIPILRSIPNPNVSDPIIPPMISPMLINPKDTPQTINKAYTQVNKLEIIAEIHQAVNSALIAFLISLDAAQRDVKTIIKNKEDLIIQRLTADFIKVPKTQNYLTLNSVKKLIEFEKKTHQKNEAILYRGGRSQKIYVAGVREQSTPIEIYFIRPGSDQKEPTFEDIEAAYKDKKNILTMPWAQSIPLGSVSYGNSLFAGYLFDITACAYKYIFGHPPSRPAYALTIDKRQYLLGNTNKLFFYSPYNTLVGFFSIGEFFHSRSISYVSKRADQENTAKRWKVAGINTNLAFSDGIDRDSSFIDAARMFVRVGNPLEKAYELSNFIQSNAFVFKVPLSTSNNVEDWFNPSKAIIDELFKNQNKLTEMLKAMLTLQQQLSEKSKVEEKKVN